MSWIVSAVGWILGGLFVVALVMAAVQIYALFLMFTGGDR